MSVEFYFHFHKYVRAFHRLAYNYITLGGCIGGVLDGINVRRRALGGI